jgi:uncharacterized OB-fold protein
MEKGMKSGEDKDANDKEPKPIGEGFFELPKSPSEKPYLIGSQCRACGEVFFPSRTCCRHCSSEDMKKRVLSRTANLYSFTAVKVKPPHFIGEVPYLVGVVQLPEGERIRTLLTGCGLDSLEIGMEMELVIESVGKATKPIGKIETGTEVLGWKFRPIRSSS